MLKKVVSCLQTLSLSLQLSRQTPPPQLNCQLLWLPHFCHQKSCPAWLYNTRALSNPNPQMVCSRPHLPLQHLVIMRMETPKLNPWTVHLHILLGRGPFHNLSLFTLILRWSTTMHILPMLHCLNVMLLHTCMSSLDILVSLLCRCESLYIILVHLLCHCKTICIILKSLLCRCESLCFILKSLLCHYVGLCFTLARLLCHCMTISIILVILWYTLRRDHPTHTMLVTIMRHMTHSMIRTVPFAPIPILLAASIPMAFHTPVILKKLGMLVYLVQHLCMFVFLTWLSVSILRLARNLRFGWSGNWNWKSVRKTNMHKCWTSTFVERSCGSYQR